MAQECLKGKTDIMTYMLREPKQEPPMSEMEIMNTVPVIIVAGSETAASAMAGLFFYLLQNPDKQRILVSEIRSSNLYVNFMTLLFAGIEYISSIDGAIHHLVSHCVNYGVVLTQKSSINHTRHIAQL